MHNRGCIRNRPVKKTCKTLELNPESITTEQIYSLDVRFADKQDKISEQRGRYDGQTGEKSYW